MTTEDDAAPGGGNGLALGLTAGGAILGGMAAGLAGAFLTAVAVYAAVRLRQQQRALAALHRRVTELERRGGAPPAAGTIAEAETAEPETTGAASAAGAEASIGQPGPDPAPARDDAAAGAIAPPPETAFERAVRSALGRAWRFLTTGNPVVRIGVVVLFFGVAFLLRYAYENALLPIELRLTGSAAGALALIAAGWRLRDRADTYGLVLQGAGVGILYLTIFAAARLYDMVPLTAAFGALVVLVVASSVLAVVQGSQALALFATSGGFLAPVLTATGEGSHVALFSYYALLNAGILAMAWFRSWRWLNWAGFVFTFVIGAAWGRQYYRPELFATTEPFLVLFFLFYLGVSVLFARRQAPALAGLVDGTLVFGTPAAAMGLQWALVQDMPFAMAYSALAAALVYAALAWWLKRRGAFGHLLGQSFVALALVFATLAVPFAVDDQRLTGAVWALEGAGVLWVGLRQRQWLARAAGLALQLVAAGAYVVDWQGGSRGMPFANGDFLGAALIAVAAGLTAWLLFRHRETLSRLERPQQLAWVWWGAAWWTAAGLQDVARLAFPNPAWESNQHEHAAVLFLAASGALLTAAARRLTWPGACQPVLLLLPALWATLLGLDVDWRRASPWPDLGWLAWPVGLAAVYWHLAVRDRLADEVSARVSALWHTGAWWLIAVLAAWTAAALLAATDLGGAWQAASWGAVPLIALFLVVRLAAGPAAVRWPLTLHRDSYQGRGPDAAMALLTAWVVLSATWPADPDPLPYLPLLHPLELTQLGILLAAWRRFTGPSASALVGPDTARQIVGAVAFVWLNLCTARAVHYYAGVSYPLDRIFATDAFQTAASILWTSTALLLMGLGARRARRALWTVGAVLLGAVVLKLFTVDLANLGVVARIVSFLTVGAIMLIIGYLAPLPPAREDRREDPQATAGDPDR